MTSGHWQDAETPEKMLELLGDRLGPREQLLFGIACCVRIEHLITHKSLKKVLGRFKKLAHVPLDRQKMMDIYNTTNPIYIEDFYARSRFPAEICTLLCASSYRLLCDRSAYPGRYGYTKDVKASFQSALTQSEGLTYEQAQLVARELMKEIILAALGESRREE